MSLESSIASTMAAFAPESIEASTYKVGEVSLDVIASPKFDDRTIAPWNDAWGAPPAK